VQNLVLKLECNLCIGSIALYNLILLLGKIREVKLDEHVEHLFFQTELGNGEVEKIDLDLCLRAVMRVG